MIKVEHVVKKFGARAAVDDVSFVVEPGTVLGFLGPNGAGKTTTMRIIVGFLSPTGGRVEVCGREVAAEPSRTQASIGYMPENTPLYDEMTVEEFLRFIAELRGFRGAERNRKAGEAMESCALAPVRRQAIETLSKGYRQRTCFAQALLHDPPVLLLDEPTNGLDPNQKQVVREMILRMAPRKTIVLSTHVLEEVEAVCSRVVIISRGKVVADSTPAALKQRSRSFNTLTLELVAPADQAEAGFRGLPDVERVAVLERRDGGACRLQLAPRNQQPLASAALEFARGRGWLVTDMQNDGGRLDEVFQQITRTDDAA
ncbi:MAG TPA: ATP-binding cassette domain-containing protein [Kiritimatiellia bacterium]|nr:ATP-binding cassette domain-containing protein [Kiritimatiellia bacterium]HRZ12463.1 ATP-binding cassette domain-containing protein [Kiritimatiellia bacterium]HSA17779.1 ATP-binding cassette domain-containing protein [Kiritimatiellia bacterium]